MTNLRIFVASPGDVNEERQTVNAVVDELRATLAPALQVSLEVVKWETHVHPAVGADAQDVVNKQIGEFDIFVGIMWRRFGTPSQRAESGTEEEFFRAYDLFQKHGRPAIMLYFKTKEFFPQDTAEIEQLGKVVKFKEQVVELGVLYGEYVEEIDFERRLRVHLTNHLLATLDLRQRSPTILRQLKIYLSYKREDLERVEPIYRILSSNGYSPWMDIRDIAPGRKWVNEIEAAIESCDVFLSFVSANTTDTTVNSQTGFSVGTELKIALDNFSQAMPHELGKDRRGVLIPVRLDDVAPPSDISQYQWLDLFEPDGMEKLLLELKALSSGP